MVFSPPMTQHVVHLWIFSFFSHHSPRKYKK